MPISVRLRFSSGVGAAACAGGEEPSAAAGGALDGFTGTGAWMPISVRPRFSSGMAGACGRTDGGGFELVAGGPGSERRVAGVRLICWFDGGLEEAGRGGELEDAGRGGLDGDGLGGGAGVASGAPHSASSSSVEGGIDDFETGETEGAGGTEDVLPRF